MLSCEGLMHPLPVHIASMLFGRLLATETHSLTAFSVIHIHSTAVQHPNPALRQLTAD